MTVIHSVRHFLTSPTPQAIQDQSQPMNEFRELQRGMNA